jgi:hypothetical protein
MEGIPELCALIALVILIYLMKKDKERKIRRRMVEDEFGTIQGWSLVEAMKRREKSGNK